MKSKTRKADGKASLHPLVRAWPFPNDALSRWAEDTWLETQTGVACWSDARKLVGGNDCEWLRNRLRYAFRAGAVYGRASANNKNHGRDSVR